MTHPSHFLAIRSHTDADNRTVLSLTGDIDLETAPHLRDQILEAAADQETVVIDLDRVQFMDSPGLGILVHCHRVLAEKGTTLVLQAPRGDVLALLHMVGMADYFNVVRLHDPEGRSEEQGARVAPPQGPLPGEGP